VRPRGAGRTPGRTGPPRPSSPRRRDRSCGHVTGPSPRPVVGIPARANTFAHSAFRSGGPADRSRRKISGEGTAWIARRRRGARATARSRARPTTRTRRGRSIASVARRRRRRARRPPAARVRRGDRRRRGVPVRARQRPLPRPVRPRPERDLGGDLRAVLPPTCSCRTSPRSPARAARASRCRSTCSLENGRRIAHRRDRADARGLGATSGACSASCTTSRSTSASRRCSRTAPVTIRSPSCRTASCCSRLADALRAANARTTPRASDWCSSTSTTSRSSTTASASRPATSCSPWSRSASSACCVRATRSRASAATSSPSCATTSRRRATSSPSPSACDPCLDRAVRARDRRGVPGCERRRRALERRTTPERLLRDASVAMFAAKKMGRGRIEVFAEPMREHAVAPARDRKSALRRALVHNEFRVHYQPLVAFESSEVIGLEALLRWQHPERGLLAGRRVPRRRRGDRAHRADRRVGPARSVLAGRALGAPSLRARRRCRCRSTLGAPTERRRARLDRARRSPRPGSIRPCCARDQRVDLDEPTATTPPRCCNSSPRSACASASTTSGPASRRSRTSVAAGAHAEDRPLVHRGTRRTTPRRRDRLGDRAARPRARPVGDRRRSRDDLTSCTAADARLRPRPGLLLRAGPSPARSSGRWCTTASTGASAISA
jgi:hypothetical protein